MDGWREEANQRDGMTQEEKGKYLLGEKFSQDPLEQHFGKHRRSCGCSDNPQLDVSMQQEVVLY